MCIYFFKTQKPRHGGVFAFCVLSNLSLWQSWNSCLSNKQTDSFYQSFCSLTQSTMKEIFHLVKEAFLVFIRSGLEVGRVTQLFQQCPLFGG